jgi:hypothetical protein
LYVIAGLEADGLDFLEIEAGIDESPSSNSESPSQVLTKSSPSQEIALQFIFEFRAPRTVDPVRPSETP